ncbi:uncharacterized protein Dwil_GK19056 [Drosophila willistoni]|uniref:Uncharacterized protein n=1 Tax=Drosophila willistoni TaxID=7260 RepID=B4MUF6_DROWI|nr:uncharacterized protein LOC6642093 [Drosophila willistoni]EDW76082.1 uncharacterized protein Dwil_GK19056 [Drosophila willistoni]
MAGCGFWLFLPLSLSAVYIINCERNYRIIFDDVNIQHWAPDLVEDFKYQLIQMNNRSYVSGHLILRKSIERIDVRTRLQLAKPYGKKIKLYDVRLEGCQFLKTVQSNRLLNVFATTFKKHTNQNLTCPFKPHLNYSMDKWCIDEQDLPSYVPAGGFDTLTEYSMRNKMVFRVIVIGRIVLIK